MLRTWIWAALLALAGASAAPAQGAGTKTVLQVAKSLRVAEEAREGYQRDAFRHWIDADGDGCSTRAEVLLAEAKQKPKVGSRCALIGGRWVSAYDGKTLAKSSGLDVDHMVPLAEAWDSGAHGWTSELREAYANDLDDPRSLIAVSASSNRSKSDRDPAEWLPTVGRCTYVANWVAVKARWQLAIDPGESAALLRVIENCPVARITVSPVSGMPAPDAEPEPAPTSTGTATEPPLSEIYYTNCSEARAAGAAPLRMGDPGYRTALDRDGDGVACEG